MTRKSTSPTNPRKSNSPSRSRKLSQAARDAQTVQLPRSPVRRRRRRREDFNIYDTQRLPNREQQREIQSKRLLQRLQKKLKDRMKIAAMQRKLMADLEIEVGPNGPIVSRDNSPRRQSNSSSDQSYHTAYGSPLSDQSYHSAYDYLDDSSIQLPRNATPPNSPDYSAQRTSTPSNYPLTPPAFFDFGGELSPILTHPRYVSSPSPQSSYVTSSSSDNRSPAQAMDISSTFLEPMDVSSRYYNSRI